MIKSEARERLLKDFITGQKAERKEEIPPISEPTITTVETEGDTTWGKLTGVSVSKFSEFKTTVYDDESWPESVRQYIPEPMPIFGYDDVFFRMAMSLDYKLNTFLWGPSGSGKDLAAKQYCALKRIPYRRVTGKEGTTPDMVIGCTLLNDKGTYFSPGDAYEICRDGGLLVLSEPAAMSRTMFALQSALEKDGHLSVTDHPDPESRMLPVNDRTLFVATSNVRGVGDNRSKYSSTSLLDSSLVNRFEATIYKPYMSSNIEFDIIKAHYPSLDDKIIDKSLLFANMIREAIDKRQIKADWSLRTIMPWLKMSMIYGDLAEGLRTTYFDKLDDAEKGAVQGFWKAVGFSDNL